MNNGIIRTVGYTSGFSTAGLTVTGGDFAAGSTSRSSYAGLSSDSIIADDAKVFALAFQENLSLEQALFSMTAGHVQGFNSDLSGEGTDYYAVCLGDTGLTRAHYAGITVNPVSVSFSEKDEGYLVSVNTYSSNILILAAYNSAGKMLGLTRQTITYGPSVCAVPDRLITPQTAKLSAMLLLPGSWSPLCKADSIGVSDVSE